MSVPVSLQLTVAHQEYHALRGLCARTRSDFSAGVRIEMVHPVAVRGFDVDVALRMVMTPELAADPHRSLRELLEAESALAAPVR
jgi:hypothetical protein